MSTYTKSINPNPWDGMYPAGVGVVSKATTKLINKQPWDAMTPGPGALSTVHNHSPKVYYRSVSGILTSSGVVNKASSIYRTLGALTPGPGTSIGEIDGTEQQAVGGGAGLEPTGALTTKQPTAQAVDGELIPGAGVLVTLSSPGITGAVTMAGDLVAALVTIPPTESLVSGVLTSSGDLTTSAYLYEPPIEPAGTAKGLAARLDLIIEQGSSFYREFLWLDEGGSPHDLLYASIKMTIRPKFGSTSVYASNTSYPFIYITKLAEDGKFSVYIKAEGTAELDFIQAVYDIEASYAGDLVSRLLEGRVLLSREVSSDV